MPDSFAFTSLGVLAALLAAGAGAGLLSGLLGIGGGVVIVPVLIEIFAGAGLEPAAQAPLAIGTAHAAVLLASISAALAHARAGRIGMPLLRAWLPPMLLGALAGLALAAVASADLLFAGFAVVMSLLGLVLLVGERHVLAPEPPSGAAGTVPPALVGALAAALGIGGGTLSGPVLALFSVPLVRAIGVGSVFNIAVAAPSTAAFVLTGLRARGLPFGTIGYVGLLPLLALTLPALWVAPWAARLAPRLPVRLLRRIFAFCLLAIAARMAWRLIV